MKNIWFWPLVTTGAGLLAAGCVERRVEYVPAYQAQPVYAAVPAYTYPSQTAYATDNTPVTLGQAAPAPVEPYTPPPPSSSGTVVVAQPPPAQHVEVVPLPPGPNYVWVPGYWAVRAGGGWIWVGGHYVFRPRPHAVWVSGHWARYQNGYVWVGGHWR